MMTLVVCWKWRHVDACVYIGLSIVEWWMVCIINELISKLLLEPSHADTINIACQLTYAYILK